MIKVNDFVILTENTKVWIKILLVCRKGNSFKAKFSLLVKY